MSRESVLEVSDLHKTFFVGFMRKRIEAVRGVSFEVPASDILQARYSANFGKLMAFQAQRANAFYEKAFADLPAEDRRTQRAGLIMAAIYRATLAEIERDGFKVLTQRTSLTPLRKLWLAWKTWISA